MERRLGSGTYAEIGTTPANTNNYLSGGLDGNTAYTFRVRAANAKGFSAYTPEVSLITPKESTPQLGQVMVDVPTVAGGTRGSGTIILTGNVPAGANHKPVVVKLKSGYGKVLQVGASVKILPGNDRGVFTFTSKHVTVTTAVVITATYNGRTHSATVNLTPN